MNQKAILNISICTLLFATVFTGAVTVSADEWPMFHHDAQHTGYTTALAPGSNNVMWNATISSVVQSSPAFWKGRLYIGSEDGNIYCIDAEPEEENDEGINDPGDASYDLIWTFTTEGSINSSPAVYDGKLYFGSDDGKVYCIYACIGTEIWNYTTGDAVSSSPTIFDDNVYICSKDGKIYCLDAQNGNHIWENLTGGSVNSSPAVADGFVYVGSDDGNIYCLYASNGTEFWSFFTGGIVRSSPAIAEGKIYVGSDDGKMYCLASNGTESWNYSIGDKIQSSPAVADEKVYVGSHNGKIYCLNASDGIELWNYDTDDIISSSPAILNMRAYIASENGNICCFRDHNPPNIPDKPDGPTQGILGEEYTFISKAIDPESDPIYYMFDWGDGKQSEWLGPYESGDVVSATHEWREEGNYSITVKAKDSYEYESDWSEPENIDINILEFSIIRGGIGVHAEIKNIGSRQLWRLKWVISYVGGRIQNPANDEFEGEILKLGAGESVKIGTGPFFEIGRIKITISLTDKDGDNAITPTVNAFAFGHLIILLR